jgi:hypothetical protein
MDFTAGLEAIRPWMSTGFIGGILAIVVKLFVDNRRLRLAEQTRAQSYQLEVSADGRTNLQFIIDNLVRDITAQRTAHEECQDELRSVRVAHRNLEGRHDGLQRQFVNYQLAVARGIPADVRSPEINAMMKTLEALVAESPAAYSDGVQVPQSEPPEHR